MKYRLRTRVTAEAIATFFLVFFGPGAAVVGAAFPGTISAIGIAAAFLLAVALLVLLFGSISGSHINPSVTIVLALFGRFPRREILVYVGAQLGGATAAALALRWLFPAHIAAAVTLPAIGWGATLAVESLLSCFLMLVILRCGDSPETRPFEAALSIGGVVGLDALVGGPLTGASMNPARTFGPALATGTWTIHWAYWIAPIGGMLLAACLHQYFRASTNVEH